MGEDQAGDENELARDIVGELLDRRAVTEDRSVHLSRVQHWFPGRETETVLSTLAELVESGSPVETVYESETSWIAGARLVETVISRPPNRRVYLSSLSTAEAYIEDSTPDYPHWFE